MLEFIQLRSVQSCFHPDSKIGKSHTYLHISEKKKKNKGLGEKENPSKHSTELDNPHRYAKAFQIHEQ